MQWALQHSYMYGSLFMCQLIHVKRTDSTASTDIILITDEKQVNSLRDQYKQYETNCLYSLLEPLKFNYRFIHAESQFDCHSMWLLYHTFILKTHKRKRKRTKWKWMHLHPGPVHFCIIVSTNSGSSTGSKQQRIIDMANNLTYFDW